eukprot:SAG31_NODE_37751_length_301_cov_2.024752_1_plen_85_part_10
MILTGTTSCLVAAGGTVRCDRASARALKLARAPRTTHRPRSVQLVRSNCINSAEMCATTISSPRLLAGGALSAIIALTAAAVRIS